MIADLKADSARWDQERQQTAQRGQPSNGISFRDSDGIVRKSNTPIVEYRASTTHQSRQYYGPTSETAPVGYQQPTQPTGQVYDSSAQSYAQQGYTQPSSGYQQAQGYAVQDSNSYVYGGNMVVDDPRSSTVRAPATTQATVPRGGNVQYSSSSTVYPQQQDRNQYYSSAQPVGVAVSSAQYATQPTDPYYGRGAYTHWPSA